MIIGIKDLSKLFAITVVTCCAVFVCTLFLNYNIDIVTVKDEITTEQGIALYEAQAATGKVVTGVSGGCLVLTTAVMMIFYIKNYIDSHGKQLGILKALGYSNLSIAKHFQTFGISVLIGCIIGYTGASLYMPVFYKVQNNEKLFPELLPQFHLWLAFCLIILPSIFFAMLSVLYGFFKLKSPVLHLLKEVQELKVKVKRKETKNLPFLEDLRKSTLRSKKILVFFMWFSAFCFSSMTQMSMSMDKLSSDTFSWMIISIGLILAFMTLIMSLTSVIKANSKTIAMMKVFGYSHNECSKSLLGVYRPVSFIGFAMGTAYQYILLKIVVNIVFANYDKIPEYSFDFKALIISFAAFIAAYEIIIYHFSKSISRMPVKGIMLE